MLMIRLQRTGRTNTATYRVVLLEKARSPKSSEVIEYLGSYNPKLSKDKQVINVERIKARMAQGAGISPTLYNFLVGRGDISGKKVNALPKKSPTKKRKAPAEVKTEAPVAVAPKPTDTPAEQPVK